jgi:SAM-dependent methyltransferase
MFKHFSDEEIRSIYNTYVKKDGNYFSTHSELSKQIPNIIPPEKYDCKTKDYPRLAAIVDLNNWLNKYNIRHFKKVLTTYRDDPELHMITWDNITVAEYDGKNNDLHTLDLLEKDFDIVIINQTLEHLYNPFQCVKNVYDHIAPGGYFYTTVPMINVDHNMPFYYWGINPLGLTLMCKSQGFTVLETGFWGSQKYVLDLFGREPWPHYNTIGDTANNPNYVCQCWVLCKKE